MPILYCRKKIAYGTVGEPTNIEGLFVGDIVEVTKFNGDKVFSVIAELHGRYFVYGWRLSTLRQSILENEMKKVHDFSEVNNELLQKCCYKLHIDEILTEEVVAYE